MPLKKGKDKATISTNIREMSKTHPHDEAVAAALRMARQATTRAEGGRSVWSAINQALGLARQRGGKTEGNHGVPVYGRPEFFDALSPENKNRVAHGKPMGFEGGDVGEGGAGGAGEGGIGSSGGDGGTGEAGASGDAGGGGPGGAGEGGIGSSGGDGGSGEAGAAGGSGEGGSGEGGSEGNSEGGPGGGGGGGGTATADSGGFGAADAAAAASDAMGNPAADAAEAAIGMADAMSAEDAENADMKGAGFGSPGTVADAGSIESSSVEASMEPMASSMEAAPNAIAAVSALGTGRDATKGGADSAAADAYATGLASMQDAMGGLEASDPNAASMAESAANEQAINDAYGLADAQQDAMAAQADEDTKGAGPESIPGLGLTSTPAPTGFPSAPSQLGMNADAAAESISPAEADTQAAEAQVADQALSDAIAQLTALAAEQGPVGDAATTALGLANAAGLGAGPEATSGYGTSATTSDAGGLESSISDAGGLDNNAAVGAGDTDALAGVAGENGNEGIGVPSVAAVGAGDTDANAGLAASAADAQAAQNASDFASSMGEAPDTLSFAPGLGAASDQAAMDAAMADAAQNEAQQNESQQESISSPEPNTLAFAPSMATAMAEPTAIGVPGVTDSTSTQGMTAAANAAAAAANAQNATPGGLAEAIAAATAAANADADAMSTAGPDTMAGPSAEEAATDAVAGSSEPTNAAGLEAALAALATGFDFGIGAEEGGPGVAASSPATAGGAGGSASAPGSVGSGASGPPTGAGPGGGSEGQTGGGGSIGSLGGSGGIGALAAIQDAINAGLIPPPGGNGGQGGNGTPPPGDSSGPGSGYGQGVPTNFGVKYHNLPHVPEGDIGHLIRQLALAKQQRAPETERPLPFDLPVIASQLPQLRGLNGAQLAAIFGGSPNAKGGAVPPRSDSRSIINSALRIARKFGGRVDPKGK